MMNPQDARFLAATFDYLQGLKLVPVGIVIAFLAVHADNQPLGRNDLSLPILLLCLGAILYWSIDRYYRRTYGRVQHLKRHRIEYILLSLVFAALGYAAFIIDGEMNLPVSLLGLLVGIGLIYDYLRLTWGVRGRYFWFILPVAAVILAISALPALGISDWWQWIGFRQSQNAIILLVGIITVIAGVGGHLILRHLTLDPKLHE